MDALASAAPDDVPAMGGTAITPNAIQASKAAFQCRVREAAETVDGLPLNDMVIAHNVTRDQLEYLPHEWLAGITTALRGDGTLVITKLSTRQHSSARSRVLTQLSDYAEANGVEVEYGSTLTLLDGAVVTPGVVLYIETEETDVHHRSMPEILATARNYLAQPPTVVQVVIFKFYPPRNSALNEHRQLRVPALAVVVERAATGHEVDISRIVSFGNADIEGILINQPTDALGDVRCAALWLPHHFDVDALIPQLDAVRAPSDHALLEVDMPPPCRPIQVDLVPVFVAAMLGWNRDEGLAAVAAARLHQVLAAAHES